MPLLPLDSAAVLVDLVVGDVVERVPRVRRAVHRRVVLVAALDDALRRRAHQHLFGDVLSAADSSELGKRLKWVG